MIFASGISTGTIVALVLNIILREDKKEKIEDIVNEQLILECEGM